MRRWTLVAAAVAAFATSAGTAVAAPAPTPSFSTQRCLQALQERTRTIIGTTGADELTGLPGDDVFDGSSGDDTLVGLGGDDCLYGITGDDVLFGLDDDDVLIGNDGNDQLVGGRGRDTMRGGDGNDRLWGGERTRGTRDEASCLDGGPGDDLLVADRAGGGSCTSRNRGATSSLLGGTGDDRLFARNFTRDFLSCGPGRDVAVVDRIDVIYRNGTDRCERIVREDVRRPSRPSLGEQLSAPGANINRLTYALARRYQPILNGFRDDFPPSPFEIIGAPGYNDSPVCGGAGDDDRFTMLSDKGGTEMVSLYRGGDAAATLRALSDEAEGPGNKAERYIDLPCGKDNGDQLRIFAAGFPAVASAPTIYTDVAPDRRTGGVALSYWFWFTFNPGPRAVPGDSGEHEGDWEHVTVYLDRRGEPREVFYATHNDGQRRRWSPSSANPSASRGLVSRSGTHVIGNIADGSHATFPDCLSTAGSPFDDVGCPPPAKQRLAVPRASVQYGFPQTQLRLFAGWACWRGRVGERTGVGQRVIGVESPLMPFDQDEVVRNGRLAGLGPVCARARQASSAASPRQAAATPRAAAAPNAFAQARAILPIPQVPRSTLPLAGLGSCARTAPGPQRGGTVVRVCVPGLLEASFEDGLRPVPAARSRQPRIVGRTTARDIDGRPVQALVAGPPSRVDGMRLRHRAARAVRARIDLVSWAGADPARAERASVTVTLPRDAQLRVTAGGVRVEGSGRTIARAAFRGFAVIEDE